MKRITIFLLILSVLAPSSLFASPYSKLLKKWTRAGKIYSFEDFHANAIVNSTYLNDEFVDGLVKEKGARFHWDRKQMAEHLGAEKVQYKNTAFFVSMYTSKLLTGFSMAETSTWKAYMSCEGKEVEARDIKNVTATPDVRHLFPYIDQWSKTYEVFFPAECKTDKPDLIMRSIEGQIELKW